MLRFLSRIVALADGISKESLKTDGIRHDALLHNLIMLGEAANRITHEFTEAHPDIAWRQIAGLRHRLVHDYDEIDYDILWETLSIDIPTLIPRIKAIIDSLPPVAQPDNLDEFA